MQTFTDIHTHILPGVDDGARNPEQAMELLRLARDEGTRRLVLTPHYRGTTRSNTPQHLREVFRQLCREAEREAPELELMLGSEIYYEADVPERLARGEILTMNETSTVLVEFGSRVLRSQLVTAVSELTRYGYTPILAHVERYDAMRGDRTLARELTEMGAVLQLNADSVLGARGLGVKWFCSRMLKDGWISCIASDAHSPDRRPPLLRECFRRVAGKYGEAYARELFDGNARQLVHREGER